MTLDGGAPGAAFRIRGVEAGDGPRRRLAELGFVPGAVVRVLTRTVRGALIVAVGETRMGLGADMSACLHVERVDA